MGIGPIESRYCSSQHNRFLHVIVCNAVVCGYRISNQRETGGHNEKTKYFASHETPPALAVSHTMRLRGVVFADIRHPSAPIRDFHFVALNVSDPPARGDNPEPQ